MITLFYQAKISVSTAKSGFIVIERLQDARDRLRVENNIAEVSPNKPFWPFVSNLAANERFLPKHMVFATEYKRPISLTEVPENDFHEFVICLNILGDARKMSGTTDEWETLPMTTEKDI